MTFWDHLEELRGVLLRSLAVVCVLAVAVFCFRDTLFSVVLAPKSPDFITYRWLAGLVPLDAFDVQLINTGLARQLMVHLEVSFIVGCLLASPWWVIELFRFILPALHDNERRVAVPLLLSGYLMFALGAALTYFLLFPLTFRMLGTYMVSPDVPNLITLDSYVDTLLMMALWMGLSFELPVICWLLGHMGMLRRSWLRRFRRHALVVILTLAAFITPTTDVFTLLLVGLPLYALYEISIWLVPE